MTPLESARLNASMTLPALRWCAGKKGPSPADQDDKRIMLDAAELIEQMLALLGGEGTAPC